MKIFYACTVFYVRLCVCMHACACMRVGACVCTHACVCMRLCACVCVRVTLMGLVIWKHFVVTHSRLFRLLFSQSFPFFCTFLFMSRFFSLYPSLYSFLFPPYLFPPYLFLCAYLFLLPLRFLILTIALKYPKTFPLFPCNYFIHSSFACRLLPVLSVFIFYLFTILLFFSPFLSKKNDEHAYLTCPLFIYFCFDHCASYADLRKWCLCVPLRACVCWCVRYDGTQVFLLLDVNSWMQIHVSGIGE